MGLLFWACSEEAVIVCMLASSILLLLPGVACGGCSEGGGSMVGKGVDVEVN